MAPIFRISSPILENFGSPIFSSLKKKHENYHDNSDKFPTISKMYPPEI